MDSTAAFKDRMTTIGLAADVLQQLTDKGWNTFGKLAFAISTSPEQLTDDLVNTWLTATFATRPETFQVGVLRRALYESHAMALVEMQKRLEAPSDISQLAVRKLPAAEREDRQRAQETKLVGVIFTPETRPSHWLVDTFVEMLEQNTLI